ncbi:MAG: PilZ domain-containing protein, partial [Clostridiales bacterium]|nr:PilZ domain-containing protein [Clostridiales bacterium]
VQEKKGTADNNNVITFEGIIKDIGGGGLRFVSNEVLEEGEKIKAAIVLNTEVIIVNGKILHKQFFPKSNYKYQYRVEFIGILKTEQEVIVQFIFEQQRKILQKTKI